MIPYIEGIADKMKKRQRNPETGRNEVVNINENYEQWLERQQQEHGVDNVDTFKEKVSSESDNRSKKSGQSLKGLGSNNHSSKEINSGGNVKYLKKLTFENDENKIKVLEDFEKSIVEYDTEHAIVITDEGNIIEVFGVKDRVYIELLPDEQLENAL